MVRAAGALDPRRHPVLAFATAAAAIVLASRAIVGSAAFAARPDPLAIGVTIDLTLGLTVVFWLTVVRSRALPPTTTIAVFLAGVALATAFLNATVAPAHSS